MEIRGWGRGGADWHGICADAVKGKMKGSLNLLSSSDLKKKSFIYISRSSIRAWRRLQVYHRSKTFLFSTFVCFRRSVCGRLAARNRENRCCMGRQSEGSTHEKGDGGRDCVTCGRSWRLVCTLHLPPRDPPQPWSGKGSLSICVGRPPASPMPVFTGNLVWLLCSLVMQGRFKMKRWGSGRNLKPTAGEEMTNVSNVAKNEEGARRYTSEYYFTSVPLLQRELNLQ